MADYQNVKYHYDIEITNGDLTQLNNKYDAIILAVAHNEFKDVNVREFLKDKNGVVYDVKGILDRNLIDGRL